MLASAIEITDKITTMGFSDRLNIVKLQINATIITTIMLSATLKVIVSMLLISLSERSAFTRQKPGTQKRIAKPESHLTITNGKLVGDIKKTETIDNTLDKITPQYQTGKCSEYGFPEATATWLDDFNLIITNFVQV